jgi:hypothetical protein
VLVFIYIHQHRERVCLLWFTDKPLLAHTMGDSGYLPEEGEEESSFALDKLGKEFSNHTMGDSGYLPEEGRRRVALLWTS